MARRNRSSQLKREREQTKRERQLQKAQKAEMKREKRFSKGDAGKDVLPELGIETADLTEEETAEAGEA
jgi:hypothetical protein